MPDYKQMLSDMQNGNWSDFNAAVKKMTKLQMLDFIEIGMGQGVLRHVTINAMRRALEK